MAGVQTGHSVPVKSMGLSDADLERLMEELAHAFPGILPQPEVLSVGTALVAADRGTGTVAKMYPAETDVNWVDSTLRAGAVLERMGAPVIGPDELLSVRTESGWVCTVWPLGEQPQDGDLGASDMGGLIRELHDVVSMETARDLGLVPKLSQVRHMVEGRTKAAVRCGMIGLSEAEEQTGALDEAITGLLRGRGKFTLLHGDAHRDNVVSLGGRAVLVDLDALSFGPAAVDLAAEAMRAERYDGIKKGGSAVLDGYGRDNEAGVDDSALDHAVMFREAGTSSTGLMMAMGTDKEELRELYMGAWRARMGTIRERPRTTAWAPWVHDDGA